MLAITEFKTAPTLPKQPRYRKTLEIYRVDHGQYPYEGQQQAACLGQDSDFPAEDIFSAGQCRVDIEQTYSTDSALNNMLTPYISSPPSSALPVFKISTGGSEYGTRGMVYATDYDGYVGILYDLKGERDCPRGVGVYIEALDVTSCAAVIQEPYLNED